MSNIKKRFIAGAVCPQCQLADKTVVFQIGDRYFSECVRCGFKQMQENEKVGEKSSPTPKASEKKIIWLKKTN